MCHNTSRCKCLSSTGRFFQPGPAVAGLLRACRIEQHVVCYFIGLFLMYIRVNWWFPADQCYCNFKTSPSHMRSFAHSPAAHFITQCLRLSLWLSSTSFQLALPLLLFPSPLSLSFSFSHSIYVHLSVYTSLCTSLSMYVHLSPLPSLPLSVYASTSTQAASGRHPISSRSSAGLEPAPFWGAPLLVWAFWSLPCPTQNGRLWASNPRMRARETHALPTELRRQLVSGMGGSIK